MLETAMKTTAKKKKVDPIPKGYSILTPHLSIKGATAALEFYKQAFGAKERMRLPGPNGTIGHAELEIGDSVVMLADMDERQNLMPAMVHLYMEDVDAVYARAIEAGGKSIQEPKDQFYGDRNAAVQDSAGNKWYNST